MLAFGMPPRTLLIIAIGAAALCTSVVLLAMVATFSSYSHVRQQQLALPAAERIRQRHEKSASAGVGARVLGGIFGGFAGICLLVAFIAYIGGNDDASVIALILAGCTAVALLIMFAVFAGVIRWLYP